MGEYEMKWAPLGKIFDPQDKTLSRTPSIFAQSPQALILDDGSVRVYFSTRVLEEESGKYLSHVAYIDMADDLSAITDCSTHEVIPLGALGCFDEHGIFPFSPFQDGEKIYAYTCGWSRRVSVSVETATGLAESQDGGKSFTKMGDGPVFASSLHHPMLVGDSFVRQYNGRYHMWYMFGTKWVKEQESAPPDRVYKIGYAVSDDQVNWQRDNDAIIADILHDNECQALPSVLYHNGYYHMVFCYRDVFGFRDDPSRGYQLGYAYSFDLKHWARDDSMLDSLRAQRQDWDGDMMSYPHLMKNAGRVYLLYNGNAFGREGFGAARLEEDETLPLFKYNSANADDMNAHFESCDPIFLSQLKSRVEMGAYIEKILSRAERYEYWQGEKLVGFLAVYHNADEGFGFITNISTSAAHQRSGLGQKLLSRLIAFSKKRGTSLLKLDVHEENEAALTFYQKHGFQSLNTKDSFVEMQLDLHP